MAENLKHLAQRHGRFIENHNWKEFQTPKSLAMALAIEASELMEVFQWHDNLSADAYADADEIKADVGEELADVLIYTVTMANQFDIDLFEAAERKIETNETRFSTERSEDIRGELSRWKQENVSESGEDPT